jgi:hypothetical protein
MPTPARGGRPHLARATEEPAAANLGGDGVDIRRTARGASAEPAAQRPGAGQPVASRMRESTHAR